MVTPPPDARVVARNACGVQAFVLPGIVSVQFHPEVQPATLDDCLARFPELAGGARVDVTALVEEARSRENDARRTAYALVDAFLASSSVTF